MEIKLSVETINQILQVLAQLPNSTGTYGLMMNIKETAEQQLNAATNSNVGKNQEETTNERA